MIASLHFEEEVFPSPVEAAGEPGLRRIDEILPAVLARYADQFRIPRSRTTESAEIHRINSFGCPSVNLVVLSSEWSKSHPK